jgi:excisionase family DNA binding protein
MIRVSRPPQARKPQSTGRKPVISCDFYDLKTVALKLGASYDTVYDAVRVGGLPFVKLGNRYRIPAKFIDNLPDNAIAEFNNSVVQL